jgi:cyclohexa-1,5-dienecarbonyl-CoA hydratase
MNAAQANTPLKVWLEKDGRLLRLRLAKPKPNLVDAAMIRALDQALSDHLPAPALSCILLDAEGPHFSFGASVAEHLPEQCADMLASLHGLLQKMIAAPLPILAAVRGQCLGGGLELACAASQIFAAGDASFGQPEIRLAVFAPAASCLLPERIGQPRAEDLLFTGRSLSASEALEAGLVQDVSENPEQAALNWFETHIEPLSASSLRYAVRAARLQYAERFKDKIARVEKLYTDELMASHDALEGLNAFLEKRKASWKNN